MRLAARYGPRYAVTRPSTALLPAPFHVHTRTINTRPDNERPPPVIERFRLRQQPNPQAQSIGILGGGITGLASAWYLRKLLPHAHVTVYEQQNRLGGWIESEVVDVDDGKAIFEWGCRTLRPDVSGSGRATIMLLLELGLVGQMIGVSKETPAATNRYIYYNDRLVSMPGPNPKVPKLINAIRNGYKLFTEPIFEGILGSLVAENWVQSRPLNMADESAGDFIRRRFGKTAADNLASAFFHGIYAGDLYKLSARTLLPALWHMETRDPEGAGVLMEMADIAFKGQGLMQYKYGRYMDLCEAASTNDEDLNGRFAALSLHMNRDISAYTFNKGMQMLSTALEEKLKNDNKVTLNKGVEVTELNFDAKTKKTKLFGSNRKQLHDHDYIVSTLSAGHLRKFMTDSANARGAKINSNAARALEDSNKSVNVGVVNLYYSNPNLIPSTISGFGYLIPRSIDTAQNPERALGVIFASEVSGVRGDTTVEVPNPEKRIAEVVVSMKPDQNSTSPLPKLDDEFFKNYGKRSDIVKSLLTDEKSSDGENTSDKKETGLPAILKKMLEDAQKAPETLTVIMGQDTARGTKLTVMLGGHWWDGWTEADLPDETQLIEMAKDLLARHLRIFEAPALAKARINRDCLPQYHVGYRQRMATVHQGLMEEFQGRLKVAGPWWQGHVGVNDCVFSAHMTAFNIREAWDDETGLKEYTEKEKWLICDRRTQTFAIDEGR